MKSAMAGLAFLAILSAAPQEDEKEKFRKEVIANVGALPKAWADARFWIVTDGKRSGWVRYQVSRQAFAGEPCLAVDYERANYLAWSERHRIYIKADEFISPRALRYGQAWLEFRVEKGKVGDSPFGAPDDPGNLVSFPEIWATLLPFREGPEVKFSTLDHSAKVHLNGSLKYSGAEKIKEGAECHKIKASFTTKPWNVPEENEMELWVRPDRTLAKTRSTINTESKRGTPVRRVEELEPVDPKEWGSSTVELNEIRALAQLSAIAEMNLILRAMDLDMNGRNDEWTGDVSGLYRLIPPKRDGPIQVISKELAMADAAPLPAGPENGGAKLWEKLCDKPVPLYGYYFKVLRRCWDSGRMEDLNDGTNRHELLFAICAYPAEYGKTGRKTFITDCSATEIWKDLKGKPAEDRPEFPSREGWQSGVLRK